MGDALPSVAAAGRYLLVVFSTALASVCALPLVALLVAVAGRDRAGADRPRPALGWWVQWHRRQAARLLGEPLDDGRPGPSGRRALRWMLAHVVTGAPFGLVAVFCVLCPLNSLVALPLWWLLPADTPMQVLGIPVRDWGTAAAGSAGYLLVGAALAVGAVPRLARRQARITLRALARPETELLAERVDELTATRVRVLDAHSAELRRIERDLHDSTQARLVAIAVRLGVAREALADDPDTVATILADAHAGAEEAMVELRDVIRTIYPPILADRGLAGAVTALCARSGVPATLDAGPLGPLPAAVEAAAYFVVAECLANVARHSRAGRAAVGLRRERDRLRIEVGDDGIGAADDSRGSGIIGIRRRAAALDGTVVVDSPAGGPTRVIVELPCG